MDLDFGPTRDFFVRYEGVSEIEQAWQLGFARREAEELYDVRKDPDQMTNLATGPAYEDIRKQLRQQLMQQLRRGQDPRVVTQPPAFDYPPYTRGDTQAGEIAD